MPELPPRAKDIFTQPPHAYFALMPMPPRAIAAALHGRLHLDVAARLSPYLPIIPAPLTSSPPVTPPYRLFYYGILLIAIYWFIDAAAYCCFADILMLCHFAFADD